MSTSRSDNVHKFGKSTKRNLIISRTVNSQESAFKKRIKDEYLPKYWQKLSLERKAILPPSEDRLSELTIKQIDRLIEMQKIKDLLYDNKKGIKPTHICSLQKYPDRHPNVYQPNFLAKINRIAMARNIRRLRSEQFDQTVLSPQQLRQRGLLMQKRNLKFIKEYRIDAKKAKVPETYQQQQQKSIGSIEDKLSDFEVSLEGKKEPQVKLVRKQSLKNYNLRKTNILSSTRWFNGMSTFYVGFQARMKKKQEAERSTCFTQPIQYSRDFDYEFEETPAKKSRNDFGIQYSRLSTIAS